MIGAVIAIIAIIVVVGGFVFVAANRNRHPADNIASFRRQIDALSSEARRQTTERMKPSEGGSTGDDGADDH